MLMVVNLKLISSGFDVATGKTYQINGSDVLSATALAATVTCRW